MKRPCLILYIYLLVVWNGESKETSIYRANCGPR
jgi:hypothetical protein